MNRQPNNKGQVRPPLNRFAKSARYERLRVKAASSKTIQLYNVMDRGSTRDVPAYVNIDPRRRIGYFDWLFQVCSPGCETRAPRCSRGLGLRLRLNLGYARFRAQHLHPSAT